MLLGARQFFERRGAPAWTNPYVTDGLVAMWDGEWNAGGGVHDPNLQLSEWQSLVNASNISRVVSSGSIADWWAVSDNAVELILTTSYRNFIWLAFVVDGLKATAPFTLNACLQGAVPSLSGFPDSTNSFMGYGSGTFRIKNDNAVYGYYGGRGGYNIVLGDPMTTTVVCSGTGITGYMGTTVEGTSAYPIEGAPSASLQINVIGAKRVSPAGSKLHSLRVYSRALTADEIAVNYAIDKARFNLP